MFKIVHLRLFKLKSDYQVMLIMTVMALLITFIFAQSPMGSNTYHPTVVIVDDDQSEMSKLFMDYLNHNPHFKFTQSSWEEAIFKVESEDGVAILRIPASFSASIKENNPAPIKLYYAQEQMEIFILEQTVQDSLTQQKLSLLTAQFSVDKIPPEKGQRAAVSQYALAVAEENLRYRKPIDLKQSLMTAQSEQNNDVNHYALGFTLFFSTFTMVFAVGEIIQEKQQYTWQRQLVTPLSSVQILAGHFMTSFILGIIQVTVLICAGHYLFGVNWGNAIGLQLLVVNSYVFAFTGLGFALAGYVKSHAQLSAIAPVLLVSTAMLGGCMWPLELVSSKWLLYFSNLMPQKWAMQAMKLLIVDSGALGSALKACLVLILMGTFFLAIGVRAIKNRQV